MFLVYLMKIQILKSKLHRAIITEVHLDYEGSCAIDEELLEAASINEYEMIQKALEKTNGKRKFAAQELGISERTLYRKLKQYDL